MRCLHLLSLHLWQQETKMCLEAASKLVFYLEKNCMRQKRTMNNKHNHLWDLIIPLQYFSLEMYHNCMFLHSQVTYTCCLSCGNQVFKNELFLLPSFADTLSSFSLGHRYTDSVTAACKKISNTPYCCMSIDVFVSDVWFVYLFIFCFTWPSFTCRIFFVSALHALSISCSFWWVLNSSFLLGYLVISSYSV